MADREPFIRKILGSDEPFECQECHWKGRTSELRRGTDAQGGTELACPRCGQAHYIFPPSETDFAPGERVVYVPDGDRATVYRSEGGRSHVYWDDEPPEEFGGSVVPNELLRRERA